MSGRDGGPAFPVDLMDVDSMGEMKVRYQEPGMSLRDWFAGQELSRQRDAAEGWLGRIWEWLWYGPPMDYEEAARDAYAMADAMLAARGSE